MGQEPILFNANVPPGIGHGSARHGRDTRHGGDSPVGPGIWKEVGRNGSICLGVIVLFCSICAIWLCYIIYLFVSTLCFKSVEPLDMKPHRRFVGLLGDHHPLGNRTDLSFFGRTAHHEVRTNLMYGVDESDQVTEEYLRQCLSDMRACRGTETTCSRWFLYGFVSVRFASGQRII